MNKLLKIIFVNQHFEDKLGGSEIVCNSYCNYLSKSGYSVTLINPTTKKLKYKSDFKIITVKPDGDSIAREINNLKADIIYWNLNLYHLRKSILQLKKNSVLIFALHNNHDHRLIPLNAFSINSISDLYKFFPYIFKHIYNFTALKYFDGITTVNPAFYNEIKNKNKEIILNPVTKITKKFNWSKPYVCWVGELKKIKRPEIFYKLASLEEFKSVDFLMIGPMNGYEYLKDNRGKNNNFFYLGQRPIEEVNGIIENSKFFISTCEPEGYGMNLIQAWQMKKPVLTYEFDPNGEIERNDIGFNAKKNWEKFVKYADYLLKNTEQNHEKGERAFKFAKTQFDLKKSSEKLIKFFIKVKKSKEY